MWYASKSESPPVVSLSDHQMHVHTMLWIWMILTHSDLTHTLRHLYYLVNHCASSEVTCICSMWLITVLWCNLYNMSVTTVDTSDGFCHMWTLHHEQWADSLARTWTNLYWSMILIHLPSERMALFTLFVRGLVAACCGSSVVERWQEVWRWHITKISSQTWSCDQTQQNELD